MRITAGQRFSPLVDTKVRIAWSHRAGSDGGRIEVGAVGSPARLAPRCADLHQLHQERIKSCCGGSVFTSPDRSMRALYAAGCCVLTGTRCHRHFDVPATDGHSHRGLLCERRRKDRCEPGCSCPWICGSGGLSAAQLAPRRGAGADRVRVIGMQWLIVTHGSHRSPWLTAAPAQGIPVIGWSDRPVGASGSPP